MKSTWSVVVLYEGARARETAVQFCERLIEKFWTTREFDLCWWSFEMLEDSASCNEATRKAAAADLLVFATGPDSLPWHVQRWVELWLEQRGEHEGALAALACSPQTAGAPLIPPHAFLLKTAHRAGLDFLTQVPEGMVEPFADTPDFYTDRAQQMTSVLQEILHQPWRPRL